MFIVKVGISIYSLYSNWLQAYFLLEWFVWEDCSLIFNDLCCYFHFLHPIYVNAFFCFSRIYTYIYIYICVCVCVCVYVCVCVSACVCACLFCMCLCERVQYIYVLFILIYVLITGLYWYIQTRSHIYECAHIFEHIYSCVCVFVCVCDVFLLYTILFKSRCYIVIYDYIYYLIQER